MCRNLKLNTAPENRPSQKQTIVFQPSIFRCELLALLVSGANHPWPWIRWIRSILTTEAQPPRVKLAKLHLGWLVFFLASLCVCQHVHVWILVMQSIKKTSPNHSTVDSQIYLLMCKNVFFVFFIDPDTFLRIIVCVHVFNRQFACLLVFHINQQPPGASIFRATCQELPCDFCPAKLKQRPGYGFLDDLWRAMKQTANCKTDFVFWKHRFPIFLFVCTAKFGFVWSWWASWDNDVILFDLNGLTHLSPSYDTFIMPKRHNDPFHASQAGSKLWTWALSETYMSTSCSIMWWSRVNHFALMQSCFLRLEGIISPGFVCRVLHGFPTNQRFDAARPGFELPMILFGFFWLRLIYLNCQFCH